MGRHLDLGAGRGLIVAFGCLLLGLCSCGDHRMQVSRAKVVSPEVFRLMYEAPRTPLCHWDYLGTRHGNHFIAAYDPGFRSWASYRYSVRTPVSELPATFPERPQQPIRFPTATQPEVEAERRTAGGLSAAESRPSRFE